MAPHEAAANGRDAGSVAAEVNRTGRKDGPMGAMRQGTDQDHCAMTLSVWQASHAK
jgi:hypothetical protein